jgi:hypothetical protein
LTDLVRETLIKDYGFDENRIKQLKDQSKTIYRIIFILDSYDEIK